MQVLSVVCQTSAQSHYKFPHGTWLLCRTLLEIPGQIKRTDLMQTRWLQSLPDSQAEEKISSVSGVPAPLLVSRIRFDAGPDAAKTRRGMLPHQTKARTQCRHRSVGRLGCC